MFLPLTIAPAILDTILGHIAPHFLKCTTGNLSVARDAASSILTVYHVETEEELRLAAEIVSFGFHVLEALSKATAPDLSLNATLRLRGSAVSLSREAHKCQRKLDQLQRVRLSTSAGARSSDVAITERINLQRPNSPPGSTIPEAAEPPPTPSQAPDLIEPAHDACKATTRKGSVQNWKMPRQQRRAAEQITANLQRNKAAQSLRDAAATPEQHQPDWNYPADKGAHENNQLEHVDVSGQPENALASPQSANLSGAL